MPGSPPTTLWVEESGVVFSEVQGVLTASGERKRHCEAR